MFSAENNNANDSQLSPTHLIKQTANENLQSIDYDFKVFDSPNKLKDAILKKNKINNKARLVAGYCWNWDSKKDSSKFDVIIEEHNFAMQWNLTKDGSLWIRSPESVNEIGCIHICQGLEVDYIGLIVSSYISSMCSCLLVSFVSYCLLGWRYMLSCVSFMLILDTQCSVVHPH